MIGPSEYIVVNPALTRRRTHSPGVVAAHHSIGASYANLAEINAAAGRRLWADLHRRALRFDGCSSNESPWLSGFSARLPCGSCRNHWQEMVKSTPPTWSDYFGWTVDRHNEVNRRLGKPEITVDAARSLWNDPGDAQK